jgi:large repetitive protein
MFPSEKFFSQSNPNIKALRFFFLAFAFVTLLNSVSNATTYTFNSKIIASNDPIGMLCPMGTDKIVIKDTFLIDVPYYPFINGIPFDGKLVLDGGVLVWSSNVKFTLGINARILLFNGGRISPGLATDIGCNNLKTIYFDTDKLASCSGVDAPHTFSDINLAGCFDGTGICCEAALTVVDHSGNPFDRTLCQAGDSVTLSVIGSGILSYEYIWSPNIGSGSGPYTVAQFAKTTYSIDLRALFDPVGPVDPYVLTCYSSATVTINSKINLATTITPVPCASSAVGVINLTTNGGTAPYKYLWSNGKTTEDINDLVAGIYTVTVTDTIDCTESKTATVTTFDNTPPTLSCPASTNGVAFLNRCTNAVPDIDATFTDNCPSAQLSYKITGAGVASGTGQLSNVFPFQVGLNNVEYQVSDGFNVVSCFFTVAIVDDQFPTASNPATLTGIQCYSNLPAPDPAVVINEADNCGPPAVTFTSQSILGGNSCPGDPLIVSRRYRVTDASGNGINVTQLIEVADTESPMFIQVPSNTTVNCQSIPVVDSASAVDNCTANVLLVYLGETRTNGICPDTYTLTRTWEAQDDCGNTKTATQVISVQDIIIPVFSTVPANVTVDCQSIPAVGTATATDNCDASVTIAYLGQTRTDGACTDSYTLSRTWEAMDKCGNTAIAEQVIMVHDITNPTFTSFPADLTVSCESIPIVGIPAASDNCAAYASITYLGETPNNGYCLDTYTLTRTWKVEDNCGNTVTANQLITVMDITTPTFTSVPGDTTVSCESIPAVGSPEAIDNCAVSVTITYNGESRTDGPCPFTYTLERQWTALDNCGNIQTAAQTITVQDLVKPVYTFVPPDITVSCESIPSVGTPIASDNCDPMVTINYIGETRQDGSCLNTYLLMRHWSAVDQCGNIATAEQVITVQDLTSPVYTYEPEPVTVSCDAIPSIGTPSAIDNCDVSVVIVYDGETRVNGSCPESYILNRKWTATDQCGNISIAKQVINVQDITPPFFTLLPDAATASCDALPSVGTPLASDNCAQNVSITYLGEFIPGLVGCLGNYQIIRTWSAQDACGNTATATQSIIVQDITPPVVISVPADILVSCDAIPALGTPTAIDNCDAIPTITYDGSTRINGTCANSYTIKRNWTISDDCGNTSTAVQIIKVQDVTPPTFTSVPDSVTVTCEDIPSVDSPTAMDNCTASVNITYNGATRIDGLCPNSYRLQRKWTAVDSCGNTATALQIITVQDLTAPTFSFTPGQVTVNCEAIPPLGTPIVTDNCDAAVSIQYIGELRIDDNCPNNYTLQRTWIATDNCGNTAPTTQTITVQDITAPLFTMVPANITVSCESVPQVDTPSATDNCDANVTITYAGETRTDGNCPNNYILKRTWSAEDDCGNINTAFQIITVQDLTNPVFTFVPSGITVNCDAVPLPETPIATDNCSPDPSIVYVGETVMNSNSPDSYILQRKWTATDQCNNISTAFQILTVQDTISPTIQCPANITTNANAATCTAIVPFGTPVTSDNCSATLTITSDFISGQAFPVGTTLVTMYVSDPTGNESSCTFKILVLDKTSPVLVDCPVNLTVTTDSSSCEAMVNWAEPTVTDPCGQLPIAPTSTLASGFVLTTGIYLVTYTAIDTSGNSTQCSFTVTVREDVPPVLIDCPTDITTTTTICTAVVNWTAPTATDNCSTSTSITVSAPPGSVFPETSTVVLYTATDTWANTATCSFTVTVVDLIPPQFSGCPDDIVVDAKVCDFPVSWVQPTATDNCDPNPTVFSIPASGSLFHAGFTIVNVFVVDPSGNQDTCTFVVEVVGPLIGLTDQPIDQSFNGCFAVASWTPPTPTGLCGPYTLTSNYAPGDTFPIGVTQVIYTLKDTLNHEVTNSFTISVTESTPPQFSCPVSTIKVNVGGLLLYDPSDFIFSTKTVDSCFGVELRFQFPEATDNCFLPVVTQVSGQISATVFALGQHTVTFQATDDAGNTALCSVQIEVLPLLPLNPQVSDAIGCKGDEITLSATPITGAHYLWTGPNPPYLDNNNIVIFDLDVALTGYYTVVADVNGCITPLDSARIRMGVTPNAVDDLKYEVATNEVLVDFNMLLNDKYELDDYEMTVINPPPGLIDHGNGLYSFQAGNENTVVYFIYKLCSKACPELCDEGIVAISVRERICSIVPNIITPNGDDLNDYLMIPCLDIEPYPQNHLVVFNQWGDKVYEAMPYSNDPDKAWRGELFGEAGKGLPDATYFFIFKATPQDKGLNGFIEIFR